MIGAILCGSETKTNWMTKTYIENNWSNINWKYLDKRPDTKPDIVGSMFDLATLINMGLSQYDIVILDVCFSTEKKETKQAQLLSGALLAKQEGIIMYSNMTRGFTNDLYRFSDSEEYKQYILTIRNQYYSNNVNLITIAIDHLKSLYKELGSSVGLSFDKIKRRYDEKRRFTYDYVFFIKN